MLVEFRIKNFRSFKEEAVFSLVASAAHKEHQDTHVIPIPKSVPFKVPGVLRTAAIYGANASGKSNLMRALQLLRGIVVDSAQFQPTETLNLQPFALDEETKGQPIEMEVTFLRDEVRYQYGFTARPERILSEWLLVYRSSKPQTWFFREFSATDQTDHYNFGASFQGQRDLWKKATRLNALFLSTAVQLNSEQLRPVYEWISNLVVFERGGAPSPLFTIEHILKTPENRVPALLHAADIAIAKIDIEKRTSQANSFQFDALRGKIVALPPELSEIRVPLFLHKAPKGSAVFGLEDESDGTQRLFHLAGPLFEIMQSGRTLCVDELDRSLHPLLVRQLVEMFYNPAINTGDAQLIFTTHDTTLLSADILRRDQVWFAEKGQEQASRLFPLTDFSARKGEAFEKGYLSGRYGAIPILNPQEVLSRGNKARGARSYKRGKPKRPPYERVLIVCEGRKTEPNYFNEIRRRFRLPSAHVHVTQGSGTECLQVVESAIELFKESREFERVYAVFDRDDHPNYATAIAKGEAHKNKLKNSDGGKVVFAAFTSVPCFEVWLLMHFQEVTAWEHRDTIIRKLRTHITGYDKAQTDTYARTSALVEIAKARAQSGRRQNDRLPGNAIYTEVDVVVDVLHGLIPEQRPS